MLRVVSPPAESVEEQGIPLGGRGPRVGFADLEPAIEGLHGIRSDRGDSFLLSFAEHPQDVRSAVPIPDTEPHEFRNPQTGGVERLQDGPVPQSLRLIGRRGLEKTGDLGCGQKVRQLSPDPRRPEGLRGVGLGDPLSATIAEEAAQAGQPPGDRRAGVLAVVQIRHVSAQHFDRDPARPGDHSDPVAEIIQQTLEVVLIRLNRLLRRVALDPEKAEKRGDRSLHVRERVLWRVF